MIAEQFLTIWLYAGIAVLLFVTAIWIVSLLKKDASIMDIFWGIGFIIVTLVYFLMADGWEMRKLLVLVLTLLWGIRLSAHIGYRNTGEPEDPRYQAWRAEGGESWWWKSYFKVFILQGIILWVISLPLLAAQQSVTPPYFTVFDWLGFGLWIFGFLFETIADLQLVMFKNNPENKGKVLDTGLWKYTRHPNYFGETVLWWGFFMFGLAAGNYITIIGPLLLTFLILKVSGVVMLDNLLVDKKPEYADYMKRTNAFFPGFPKREKS